MQDFVAGAATAGSRLHLVGPPYYEEFQEGALQQQEHPHPVRQFAECGAGVVQDAHGRLVLGYDVGGEVLRQSAVPTPGCYLAPMHFTQQRCFSCVSDSSSDDDGPTCLNLWNPVLDLVAQHMIGLHFDMLLSDTEMGRLVLCCHFSLDILCAEAHNATTWYAEVEPCRVKTGRAKE